MRSNHVRFQPLLLECDSIFLTLGDTRLTRKGTRRTNTNIQATENLTYNTFSLSRHFIKEPVPRLSVKTVFPGVGISIVKIGRSWDCLIFMMGIPLPVKSAYFFYWNGPLDLGASGLDGLMQIRRNIIITQAFESRLLSIKPSMWLSAWNDETKKNRNCSWNYTILTIFTSFLCG